MKIKTNVVFEHLLNSNKKITIEQGGTRSGKTYNILLYIIFKYCLENTGKTITICRKTFPAVRSSVMRDFLDILKQYNSYSEAFHNKSNHEYRLNDNLIEFISLDQPQKVRGRKRNLLFINEANELDYEDWQQLVFRTEDKIIIDFNPSDEYHWIYDRVIPREDADFYITTYLDNMFLNKSIKEEIERLKDTDETYWQIYGLGLKGVSKATIFNYTEVNQIPHDAEFISYGADAGYSNDPTTLVSVYRKEHNLYIKEHIYQTQMTTYDISRKWKEIGIQRETIYFDSAEPRLIEELRRMGFNVRPSLKGADSINAGIDLLKRFKIHIEKDSNNCIQEFRNYKWQEDRSGKMINKPIDKNNHCFVGDTLITTDKGQVKMSDIKVGDKVLTSEGYKRVLKKFNNGIKQVNNYSMQFGTIFVNIHCTDNHKFKTSTQWIEVSKLQKGSEMYLHKPLTKRLTTFTKMKDITLGEIKGFIGLYGKLTKEKYLKGIIYTILMVILKTMTYLTYLSFIGIYTLDLKAKKGLKRIKFGLKSFTLKVLKRLRNGISQKRVGNGIVNTQKNNGLIGKALNILVKNVETNIQLNIEELQSTAITTARLKQVDVIESYEEVVYDIMVEDCHEYFANGVLVHNCIDAVRYATYSVLSKPNFGKYAIQ